MRAIGFLNLGLLSASLILCQACFAGDEVRIPVPSGFLEGSALSKDIKAMALSGQLPSVKLLGAYYPPDALAEILNKGYTAPSPFAKALIEREYASASEAKKGFRQLVENAKKEAGGPLNLDDPAVKRILKHYEDSSRNLSPEVGATVAGTTPLGTLKEDETTFAVSMLINFKWSDGASQVDMPFVAAIGWVLLGKQQLGVSVCYPFQGEASIRKTNEKLSAWLAEISKLNK